MSFWQRKKVFITGHTGFKGGWLSLWLQALGANVVGFSLQPNTTPNLFTTANIANGMTSIIGDINHFSFLQENLELHEPDIIFHLAAQPLVRYSYQHPVETYATNVLGTVHLLEAARHLKNIKAIINVTSDKCYENKNWQWGYRETDVLGGFDPYSNSKACAELVTSAYQNSFFSPLNIGIASVRAGNVIGGGDWADDRLIPDFIRAAYNHQTTLIRHPNAKRPWQHVLEPLNGYLLLAEHLYHAPSQFSGAWNFGPDFADVKPVAWLADKICEFMPGARWVIDQVNHPHEMTLLSLDSTKARSELNWQPRWNLETALKNTVDWYQAFHQRENMYDFTLMQLNHFMHDLIRKEEIA